MSKSWSRVCSQPVTTRLEPQIIESKITCLNACWGLANHVMISLPSRKLTYATLGKRKIIFKCALVGDMLAQRFAICFWTFYIWLVFVWYQRSTVLAIAFQAQLCFWCVFFFGRFAIPADAGPSWHPDSDICRKSTSKCRGVGFSECKNRRSGRMQMLGLFKTCWFELN